MGKPKVAERLIMRRFFKRKSKDPVSYEYMKSSGHKKLYAESVLALNEAARATGRDAGPYLMPMCLPVRVPDTCSGDIEGIHAHVGFEKRGCLKTGLQPRAIKKDGSNCYQQCVA